MDQDDRPIGRILSRRELVRLLAIGSGAAALPIGLSHWGALWAAEPKSRAMLGPSCMVRPEREEGPYFLDHQLNRSDIRVEPSTNVASPGLPLALELTVLRAGSGNCGPLAGASVDIWHCDASGDYSGFASGPGGPGGPGGGPDRGGPGRGRGPDRGGPPGGPPDGGRGPGGPGRGAPPGQSPANTLKFLRGVQITDAKGIARFTTIYPGWYSGRTVHVHLKIRTTAAPTGAWEFTSQLFFDDTLTDQIHAQPPYAARGHRDTTNRADGIFQGFGDQLTLAPVKQGDGLAATFVVGLDLSDAEVGRPDGNGARGRGGRGG